MMFHKTGDSDNKYIKRKTSLPKGSYPTYFLNPLDEFHLYEDLSNIKVFGKPFT